ncbi:MAG: transketolase family protein [Oscillospiraceae bacterium]
MERIATRAAYGEALVKLGAQNPRVAVLDADLSHATMTVGFAKAYPNRFFNVGIAEANMATMAVGLAEMGFVPFISTFAVFGTGRAFEQVRNSIAYPHSNVKLAFTHGGVSVGEDGGSHAAIEDIALMRVLPGMMVLCPCDAAETEKAVQAAAAMEGPVYLRLARMPSPCYGEKPFTIGKANVMRDGGDVAIFACGLMVEAALGAAEALHKQGIEAAVVNMHTIKPVDAACVRRYAEKCKKIVTLEEHSVIGGLGDAVGEVLLPGGAVPLQKLGIQDVFGTSGKPEEVLRHYRLNAQSVAEDIARFLASGANQ